MEREALERVKTHILGLERTRRDAEGILYSALGSLNSGMISSGLLSITTPLIGRWASRERFTVVLPGEPDLDISLVIVMRIHSKVSDLEGMALEEPSARVEMNASLLSGPSNIDLGSTDEGDEVAVESWFSRFRDTVTLRLLAARARDHLEHELRTDVEIHGGP